ncbi:MAG: RNA polymerase sigma factor [Bacteroidota bacterium]|nr:RNA polymerase sigma factor [Bacteroidota bacterium]
MTGKTDQELVTGCLQNNPKFQKELFDKFKVDMMRICLRYARDEEDAKDVMQKGFIKVYTKFDHYNGQGSLRAWLQQIMIHTAIDHYRQQQRNLKVIVSEQDFYYDTEPATIESELAVEDILKVIQSLGFMQRTIFNLFAIEGHSHKEIAAQLNITESTSKWYLCEGRKEIKRRLKSLQIAESKTYVA